MNSPIPYFGGKSRLAKDIITRLPAHKTYAEVFGGAAWVLFKKEPSPVETLNDLDRHLMNFYRVAKHHPQALADEIASLQPGRDLFYQFRDDLERPVLTDIQRAAIYYYIQRQSFAGRPRGASVATSPNRPPRCRAAVARILPQVAERFQNVMLENLPWEHFIKLYDSPDTFFFVDPPYLCHNEYRHNFKEEDFLKLAETLKGLKGKFLMTHADSLEIRDIFKGLRFEKITLLYTARQMKKGGKAQQGQEVLISNY